MLLPGAAVLACTGCTGGDDAAPTTTATITTTTVAPTTVPPPTAVTETQVATAIASRDAGTLADLARLTEPASPAAAYLSHQVAARTLLPTGEPATVRSRPDGVQVCDIGGPCTTIDALTTDPATGLLRAFSVGGMPVAGRVTGAGSVATADGLDVVVRSAALGARGGLTVVIDTHNPSGTSAGVEWFAFAASYADADGSVVEALGAWGEPTVAAGTVATMLIAFPDATLPGAITLPGLRDDDVDVSVTVEVPAPG